MGAGCSSSSSQEGEGGRSLERRRRKHCCSLVGKGLKSVPPAPMEASNLLRLDLSGNQLSDLPRTLGKLVNLQQLLLRGNRLVGLPEQIGLCAALEEIYADRNRLVTLPPLGRGPLQITDTQIGRQPDAYGHACAWPLPSTAHPPREFLQGFLAICTPSRAACSHLVTACAVE